MRELVEEHKYVVYFYDVDEDKYSMKEVGDYQEMQDCKGFGDYAGSSVVKCIVPRFVRENV